MTGHGCGAGHTTAPDHMPDRAQDSACTQGGTSLIADTLVPAWRRATFLISRARIIGAGNVLAAMAAAVFGTLRRLPSRQVLRDVRRRRGWTGIGPTSGEGG